MLPELASGVVACAGARAVEARLLDDLGELLAAARAEPALLARPLRVLTASRALRDVLAARIVERHGPAVLGVSVQTLWSAAHEALERAGRPVGTPLDAELLLELTARREAAREPVLRQALEGLEGGLGLCAPSVRDLLSANLRAEHALALEAALSAHGHAAERERARALLRVALRCDFELEAAGSGRPGAFLLEAADALEAGALPARAVLIHGFADATGLVLAFLAKLVRALPVVRLYLDTPLDAADDDPGGVVAYAARLGERLRAAAAPVALPIDAASIAAPRRARPEGFDTVGAEAEVREAGYRIRELLDRGARAEGIALVARDLGRYLLPVRRLFSALGIPWSGPALPAGLLPARRRLEAVLDLLRLRGRAPLERWLEAVASLETEGADAELADLRLALRAAGAARLAEVATLEADALVARDGDVVLPARRGLEQDDKSVRAPHRRLPGAELRQALALARSLVRRLEGWPARASLAEHLEALAALLVEELGWRRGRVGAVSLDWPGFLRGLGERLPPALLLDRDELLLVLERSADELGREPAGGHGAGVRVLEVTHARGQTFDALFLLGLNRELFPRPIHEDPLLPDALRARWLGVLPDLPLKRRGALEERHLFAELLSASEQVTISWQRADEDGRPRSPSPLLERLRHSAPGLLERAAHVPRLWERTLRPPCAGTPSRPRTARELLRLAALAAPRACFEELYPFALREAAERFPGPARLPALRLAPLARARVRVLEELDPDLRTLDGRARMTMPSPYLGLCGPTSGAPPAAVTTLEALARCPWQAMLERLLRLEATPDPLAELPGLGALSVGNVVHGALARLFAARGTGRELGEAVARGPISVGAPEAREVARALERAAEAVAREAGITWPALREALEARAQPYLQRALELDLGVADARLALLGAELAGSIVVGGRSLAFRADRVDQLEEGRLRLSDYKTGAPLTRALGEEARLRRLRQAVARGEALQIAAYLAAAVALGARGRGRYLYLDPALDASCAELSLEETDAALRILPGTVALLCTAWEQGVFFPRLEDPHGQEPRACERCALAEACVRGDSGMRRRLRELVAHTVEQQRAGVELGEPLATLLALFALPAAEPAPPAPEAAR
jgi:RecB family exonuclease